jgi:thiol-disulfide isomerase/thioredoxin
MSLFSARRGAGTARSTIEGHLPSFHEATGWLNSEPLTPEELRGRVVFVDFWTYTCINWLRTLGYVRGWAEKYEEQGLVVVGVHTPEFPFEHDADNVREAVKEMRVQYPVALDNDYGVWNAFSNHYWPAVYIADADGRIRHHQFGEGGYDECERIVQRLLGEAGHEGIDDALVAVAEDGFEAQADWNNLGTPETYLGYQQAQNFASPGGADFDRARTYSPPDSLRLNQWALSGDWTVESGASFLKPGRRSDRVPLPRPRRPSRHGAAQARFLSAVPGAHRRRASRRRSWARR